MTVEKLIEILKQCPPKCHVHATVETPVWDDIDESWRTRRLNPAVLDVHTIGTRTFINLADL